MPNKINHLRILFSLCLLVLSIALGACGIKPDNVEPPPGAENVVFPQTYPAPDPDRPQ